MALLLTGCSNKWHRQRVLGRQNDELVLSVSSYSNAEDRMELAVINLDCGPEFAAANDRPDARESHR